MTLVCASYADKIIYFYSIIILKDGELLIEMKMLVAVDLIRKMLMLKVIFIINAVLLRLVMMEMEAWMFRIRTD